MDYLDLINLYKKESSDVVKEFCFKSIEVDSNLSDAYVLICNSLLQEIYGNI